MNGTKDLAWAGTEVGAAGVLAGGLGGGLGGVGPPLALKQPGKQTALRFSCLVVKNLQTRQPVLHTPAEEAAHQALQGLLAGGRKIHRKKGVLVPSLSFL